MKRLAFFFLICSPFLSPAQTAGNSQHSLKPKSLYIGINLSPDACRANLKNDSAHAFGDTLVQLFEGTTTYKFGYTGSINLLYIISNHFAVETGIQYANKGDRTKETEVTYGYYVDPRHGFTYQSMGKGADIKSAKFIWNYHYIGIPLMVNYEAGKSKLVFSAATGITFEYLINTTITTVTKDFEGDKNKYTRDYGPIDYHKINLSPTLSAGVKYKWNEKMFLKVEPTVRYGVIKLTDTDITSYLWNAGLNLGFYYSL